MKNTLEHFIQTYEELKGPLKWKLPDKRILATIASIYVLNKKPLTIESLLTVSEQIKSKASLFSPLRSYSRFTTATMLDVNFDQPDEKVQELFDIYDLFRKEKFASGAYTYIAAGILLTNGHGDLTNIIQKAKGIYVEMRRKHAFLTSSSDYPLATLLALEERQNVVEQAEVFYEELSKNGFRKGNDLQFLSHILALGKDVHQDTLVSNVIQISDAFTRERIRMKPMYYPALGMLALLPQRDFSVRSILSIYEELNQHKDFKWQKDMNLMIATSLFVGDKTENSQLTETSLSTILEAIMQAQFAMMVSIITATTVTNSNAGN